MPVCVSAPQDAQEYFLLLMNTIHDGELVGAVAAAGEGERRAAIASALDRMLADGGTGPGKRRAASRGVTGSPLRNPFEGLQATSVLCKGCGYKYVARR